MAKKKAEKRKRPKQEANLRPTLRKLPQYSAKTLLRLRPEHLPVVELGGRRGTEPTYIRGKTQKPSRLLRTLNGTVVAISQFRENLDRAYVPEIRKAKDARDYKRLVELLERRLSMETAIHNMHHGTVLKYATYADPVTSEKFLGNWMFMHPNIDMYHYRSFLNVVGGRAKPGDAMLMLDSDRLKHVIDVSGDHDLGDRVLRLYGKAMKKVRKKWGEEGKQINYGRFGGDEFLVHVPGGEVEDTQGMAIDVRLALNHELNRTKFGRAVLARFKRHGLPEELTFCVGAVRMKKGDIKEMHEMGKRALGDMEMVKSVRLASRTVLAVKKRRGSDSIGFRNPKNQVRSERIPHSIKRESKKKRQRK